MGRGLSEQQRAILALALEHRARYPDSAAVFVAADERRARELREDRYHIHVQNDWDAAILPRFGNRIYCDLFRHEVLSVVYGVPITGPHAGSWRHTGAELLPAYRDQSADRDPAGTMTRMALGTCWFDGATIADQNYASLNASASRALSRLIRRELLVWVPWGYNLTAAGTTAERGREPALAVDAAAG